MNDIFTRLKAYSDRLGLVYGTEDLSLFLYSLVKMHKPQQVLELGTGCGVTTCWMAQALKENGSGKITTVDDGSQWPTILTAADSGLTEEERKHTDYPEFMQNVLKDFALESIVECVHAHVPPFPKADSPYDFIFSDFAHGPTDIIQQLVNLLPRMAPVCSLLIDSASTHHPSYLMLETLIPQLNQGKIPQSIWSVWPEEIQQTMTTYVQNSRFTLIHLTEVKNRAQNSTAWIKIEPVDIRPYPATSFH